MESLKDLLKAGAVRVEFEKANGELREMLCTTKQDLYEDKYEFKGGSTKAYDPDSNIVTVWDLEKEAFRSFNTDRVLGWSAE